MFNIRLKRGSGIAIDLGNSNTVLATSELNYVSQPSCIAWHRDSHSVKAVGQEAYEMLGKANGHLRVLKPLKEGVIVDYESASCMLKYLVKQYPRSSLFGGFDDIVAGIPYDTTEVERRALRDALEQFGGNRINLVFEPVAAAIGLGLNIQEPDGKFLVDIGGGITEIVVLSLSGVVSHQSIKVAGDTFDEDIQQFFKSNYNMSVGTRIAEQLKIKVGAATESWHQVLQPCNVVGKDLMTGLPAGKQIDHEEIAYILNNVVAKIEQAVLLALEECPPELAGDIYENGIHLTGGGSLLRGLKQRLEEKTKLPVHHDENALLSVAKGLTTIMQEAKNFKPVVFQ